MQIAMIQDKVVPMEELEESSSVMGFTKWCEATTARFLHLKNICKDLQIAWLRLK